MFDHILKTSLDDNRVIKIIYQRGEEITERDICVQELNQESIKAYCYLRKQNRIFKRDSILAADFCREKKYMH